MTQSDDYETFRELLISLVKKFSNDSQLAIEDHLPLTELGVDSIDIMEIVFDLEERYGVELSDESVLSSENFGALCTFLFSVASKGSAEAS